MCTQTTFFYGAMGQIAIFYHRPIRRPIWNFQTGIFSKKFKVFSDRDSRQGKTENIQSIFRRGFQTGKK